MNKKDTLGLIPLLGLIYIYIHRKETTTLLFIVTAGTIQAMSIVLPLIAAHIYFFSI